MPIRKRSIGKHFHHQLCFNRLYPKCVIFKDGFNLGKKNSWVDFNEVKMYALEAYKYTGAFLIYSIIF